MRKTIKNQNQLKKHEKKKRRNLPQSKATTPTPTLILIIIVNIAWRPQRFANGVNNCTPNFGRYSEVVTISKRYHGAVCFVKRERIKNKQ